MSSHRFKNHHKPQDKYKENHPYYITIKQKSSKEKEKYLRNTQKKK